MLIGVDHFEKFLLKCKKYDQNLYYGFHLTPFFTENSQILRFLFRMFKTHLFSSHLFRMKFSLFRHSRNILNRKSANFLRFALKAEKFVFILSSPLASISFVLSNREYFYMKIRNFVCTFQTKNGKILVHFPFPLSFRFDFPTTHGILSTKNLEKISFFSAR